MTSERYRYYVVSSATAFLCYHEAMQQPRPDPFFEQLKDDIQEGIEAADRFELLDEDVVWEDMRLQIDEVERTPRP